MKSIHTFLFFLFAVLVYGQEFETYENGMIYSPLAMHKLSKIVGDKNNEFRKCELAKEFRSFQQAKGIFFTVSSVDRKKLKEELMENISFTDFFEKYGTEKDLYWKLITKRTILKNGDEKVVRIREAPNGKVLNVPFESWEQSVSNNWIFDFSNNNKVSIVYIQKAFKSQSLPEKYARMIQYSECMIDTTTQIFSTEARRRGMRYAKKGSSKKRIKFFRYIDKNYPVGRPDYPSEKNATSEDILKIYDSIHAWETSKRHYVKTHLAAKEDFCALLNDAYAEATEHRNSSDEFEYYVASLMSNKKALELKRGRIVVGFCSMDDSPRIHAMNIAQLSAESFSWDVFLRSHLNIMNDRMNRVSDGSWAWGARKTYIRELEELNIEILDLMLGISFRIDNPATGHYYGSIGRIGRAISESKYVDTFEGELILAIGDDELDDYNRLLMYYLYENLEYHKDKSEEKNEYKNKTKDVAMLLPEHLRPENA